MNRLHTVDQDRSPIVGIDLGTTNSLVAIVRDGQPVVLKSRDGRNLIPSVVSFAGDEPVVGLAAKRAKVRDSEHTVFSVKRLLGRGFDDVKEVAAQLPYQIVPCGGPARVRVGERTYTAVEISAMILRELKLAAEQALGQSVGRAVITVPAYFNDAQRQATRSAGRLAGLEVLRIINEPTAASLAYGLDRKREGLIAVYDLGGGTFDVSILRLHDGIFEVLATNGDTALGGDDLDRVIVQEAAREIRETLGVDVFAESGLRASLIEAAENVKIALSTTDPVDFEVEVAPGRIYRRQWTRAEFEEAVRPMLERTREPCLRAVADAGLKISELSDVVLVGGPTRLQVVQRLAREIFGREPNTSVHPDEVVACGAAIQADILAGNNRELLLLDVVPLSLGIETYGGVMSTLIPRNTRIPVSAREGFTTFVDNQTGVDVHVLQGERERVEDNRSLARFKLKGIEPMPAGLPRVEVTFLIDADGILQVSACDQKTGNEQSIEVRPTFGLTDQEVEHMLRARAEHENEDEEHRKLVDARNRAEPVLRATERRLVDARRLLSGEELRRVEKNAEVLRVTLQGSDLCAIETAALELDLATKKLADLIVKDALCRK